MSIPTPAFPVGDDLESRLRFKAWQIQHDRPDSLGRTLSTLLLEAADAVRGAGSAGSPEPSVAAIEAAGRVMGEAATQLGGEAFSFDRMPEDNLYWAGKIVRAAYEVDRGAASPSSGEPT